MYIYIFTFVGFNGEGAVVVAARSVEHAKSIMGEYFRKEGFAPEGEENWHPDHPDVFNCELKTERPTTDDVQPEVIYVNYSGEGYR